MLEIWGTYSTEKAARRGKNAGCSLAAAKSVHYSVVSFLVWVCACVAKHGCVCATHSAFMPVFIWITAFELWERAILETAVNNKIQLLGFFPKTWTYTVQTLPRTWLMGNYTNFHSAFFIFTTDTQAIIRCVPLRSYKCSAQWKTCNSISVVYYCYYW